MPFNKFTSIDAFKNVWHSQRKRGMFDVVEYQKVIKLHGTNGAIRYEGNTVTAQKRTSDVFAEDDNQGFATFVKKTEANWKATFEDFIAEYYSEARPEQIVVYGEWAGNGIQNKDAVTMLKQKYFFVFAVEVDGVVFNDALTMSGATAELDNVLVLQCDEIVSIDFADDSSTRETLERLSAEVEEVGKIDPFIKSVFEVEGPGEGYVLSPMTTEKGMSRNNWAALTFKAKCEDHRVQKTKAAASIRVQTPADVIEFGEMFVTPQRCEQAALEACNNEIIMQNIRAFLNWMQEDVRKESTLEIEKMGKTYSYVAGQVAIKSKEWFMKKARSEL